MKCLRILKFKQENLMYIGMEINVTIWLFLIKLECGVKTCLKIKMLIV